ncbi:DMT family transporter [Nordella sp. HKS 07]|uniref:DMT family transporter n=1 Tax=Nordella sp. HKS 07 TaxID=2712222 RepID=UPI0013E1A3A4|nr:DMT family transporter [Nordella sp. HKS 07]QIG50309.1 DMT family transporter [Nordella sp. HKS 07]
MNPVLLGTLAALCWGMLDFMASKIGRRIGPLPVAAAVTLFGLILITVWLLAFHELPVLSRSDIGWPIGAGVAVALATWWLFTAIASGPVSLAVPVTMSYPATSVLLGALLGSVPSQTQLAFVALILFGAFLVAWGEAESEARQDESPRRWRRTVIFAILAHLAFVFGVFAGQKSALLFDEIQTVWISRLAGSAIMLPLLLARPASAGSRLSSLPALVAMGLLDVVGITLLFAAGKTDQPELATVCATASGAITIVLARIFLKEKIAYLRWLGIVATFSGIAALSAMK